MKRFLKHNRYELDDRERENIWYAIRRDLIPDGRPRWISMRVLRPALAGVATVATLAVLGVWWIGSNQADKIPTAHPGLLAEAPETRSFEGKAPGTEALDEIEVAAVEPEVAKTPRGAPAPAGISFSGRILDQETGEGLAYANVRIRGTSQSVLADSTGAFHLENLTPGQDINLVIMMLGYAPMEQLVRIPDEGPFEYAFNLESVIVDTLQAFDVAGAEYMVEVKSAVTRRQLGEGSLSDKDQAGTAKRENDAVQPESISANTPLKIKGLAGKPAWFSRT
jgi:hypothetical protein